ncbi:PIR protein [Plasmodium ovale]|uniref:PIR Superfamily Protein n=2 Tax=Plasmodium ovale TaxID=36330 RepID=A0A1A8WFE0_PLAOA|nr:PIR Superfamily Protein [Plasmodium ovale curtisi]SBS99681.1 PIR Superfamily Protein [Plasmodium ovale curtisi]SBT84053.1 PIR protein [Plasmodium ovale]
MTERITKKNLPSAKFEELKNIIEYKKLEGYVKSISADDEVEEWIIKFESNIKTYLMKESVQRIINEKKGCKDFNYLIYNIVNKFNSFPIEKLYKSSEWSNKIKNWHNNYPSINQWYKCDKNNKYYHHDVKKLYDFCEDSKFINENIHKIKNVEECQLIINNMSSRMSELISIRDIVERKRNSSNIPDTCSAKNLENMLSLTDCKSITERASTLNEVSEPGVDVHAQALKGRSRAHTQYPDGELPLDGEKSLIMSSKNSKNNAVGLVSLPILGVLAFSFLLYRYTPLGSKLHTYFRNKVNISINQEDDSSEQILYNTSNSNDVYSEKMQYNLSY